MARIDHAANYFAGKRKLSELSADWQGIVVKRCYQILNMSQRSASGESDLIKRREIVLSNDTERISEIEFATNTLVALGFKYVDYNLSDSFVFWRRIRQIKSDIALESNPLAELLKYNLPVTLKSHLSILDKHDRAIRAKFGSVGLIDYSECLTFSHDHVMRFWIVCPKIGNASDTPFLRTQFFATDGTMFLGYTLSPYECKWQNPYAQTEREVWPVWVEGFHGMRDLSEELQVAKMVNK